MADADRTKVQLVVRTNQKSNDPNAAFYEERMISVNEKLGRLPEHYRFPDRRPELKQFYWSLDGGGRETIIEAAQAANVQVILEVGVFLGGSALQWLKAMPNTVVVGVDPYSVDCALFYENFRHGMPAVDFGEMTEPEFVEQMKVEDSQYLSAVNNLWDYKDRFLPVRGSSPDILYRLHELGLKADLCYLDADKKGMELEVFRRLWPEAIICGDDWEYMADPASGVFDIRDSVISFAKQHGLELHVQDASWILKPPQHKSFWKRMFQK